MSTFFTKELAYLIISRVASMVGNLVAIKNIIDFEPTYRFYRTNVGRRCKLSLALPMQKGSNDSKTGIFSFIFFLRVLF